MRDSQSLLEQLLAVADKRISAADVNSLLGTAPVERLSGLVGHLAARDAGAALAEMDGALSSGVDVGQLLDQLIGYFRDVMAVAVGCGPQQMLYALPSQAEEVAAIGRQLGLPTILAMVQILDQTAARLRVSLHGRTLVEMAIVRICSLENLDDLAGLVAELRTGGAGLPAESAKKNIEPRPRLTSPSAPVSERPSAAESIGTIPRLAEPAKNGVSTPATAVVPTPPTSATPVQPKSEPAPSMPENGDVVGGESVLEQFRNALAGATQSPTAESPQPPRMSLRQQKAEIEQQPFVRRAMELFDVAPGSLRYSPPENNAN